MNEAGEKRRPRSSLRVLSGLLLALVAGLALVGACLSLFVSSTPRHTIEVPIAELTTDLPKFYAQPSFGADASGRTFGVWVLIPERGETRAFSSRDPSSGCFVNWRGDLAVGGVAGVFVDSCDGSAYDGAGIPLSGPASRGIDVFEVERTATTIVVDLERLRLGACRAGAATSVTCSAPGQPQYEDR